MLFYSVDTVSHANSDLTARGWLIKLQSTFGATPSDKTNTACLTYRNVLLCIRVC